MKLTLTPAGLQGCLPIDCVHTTLFLFFQVFFKWRFPVFIINLK